MSTHNICFRRVIRKILCGYPLLSVAMLAHVSGYAFSRCGSDVGCLLVCNHSRQKCDRRMFFTETSFIHLPYSSSVKHLSLACGFILNLVIRHVIIHLCLAVEACGTLMKPYSLGMMYLSTHLHNSWIYESL